MNNQTVLNLKRFCFSPQLISAALVLLLHCWSFWEAGVGQDLLPKSFHSDANLYHFAAWFNAFVEEGGYISGVISLSPYRILLTEWYLTIGNVAYAPFLLNAILSAASSAALVSVSQLVFDQKTAWLTGIIFALSAQILFFSGIAGKTMLVLVIFNLSLYFACLYLVKGQRRFLTLATILILFGSIDRPNVLTLLIAILLVILTWTNYWSFRKRLIDATLILIIVAIAQFTSKWNYGGEPSYYSPIGLNIYLGHSKPNNWSLKVNGIRNSLLGHRLDSVAVAEQRSGRKLSKIEASQYWILQAVDYAKDNPRDYLLTQAQKFAALAAPTSLGIPEQLKVARVNRAVLKIAFIDFAWIYALAGVFFVASLAHRISIRGQQTSPKDIKKRGVKDVQKALMILGLLGYIASILLTFVVERYRLPLLVFLIPFASAGVLTLFSVNSQAKRILLIITAVIIFTLSHQSQSVIPYGYGWSKDVFKKALQLKKPSSATFKFHQLADKALGTPNISDCRKLKLSPAKKYYGKDHARLISICMSKLKEQRHSRRNRAR